MRKYLAALLLTFRWLLVPVLPVLGLLLGLWLKPGMKPRWEREVGSITKCAGILEDGQNTCLLTYGRRYYENEIQTHQLVAGLSLANGEELFTRKIPARSHDQVILVPGTTLAMCCRYDPSQEMILYDWNKEAIVHHLTAAQHIWTPTTPRLKNGVLAVLANRHHTDTVFFWHLGADAVTEAKNGDNLYGFGTLMQLSSTGTWASVCYGNLVRSGVSVGNVENGAEVLDTKHGGKGQALPREIRYIHWHPAEDSFLALHDATKETGQHWQKYVREKDSFVPAGPALVTHGTGVVVPQNPGPYIVLATSNIVSNKVDSLHNRVKSFLGKSGENLVKWLWNEAIILDIHHGSTGELVNSIVISDVYSFNLFDLFNGGNVITIEPEGEGLVLQKEGTLSYWNFSEFHSVTRWYPCMGLGLGVILSILVARWNLRRVTPAISSNP